MEGVDQITTQDPKVQRSLLFTLLLVLSIDLKGQEPPFLTFIHPQGWKLSDPSFFEDTVKIGFIQSSRKVFSPAITLSIENIGDTTPSEYFNAVKKLHLANPRNRYKELGFLDAKGGRMHLIQIDEQNQYGNLRIFQATLITDGYAIIQTATTLKEGDPDVLNPILKSFRSLTLHPNLFCAMKSEGAARELQGKIAELKSLCTRSFYDPTYQKNHWNPFVEYFTQRFKNEMTSWQILAINAIQEQLVTETTR